MADDYVCTLDEASVKVAKDELHEDPKERLGQVATLRNWIFDQKHLTCPTDTRFLLKHLRGAKYSQLKAREKIEAFYKFTTDNPKWASSCNPLDPAQLAVLKYGYMLPLGYDKHGRLILLDREGAIDTENKRFTKYDIFKAMMAVIMYTEQDERTQVNGVVYLVDLSGMTMKHQMYWGLDDIKKMTTFWLKCVPGRYKAFHCYNGGPVFDTMMAITVPLMPKKYKERFVMHGDNLEGVYKHIPMELLPREYLPDEYTGPCAGTVQEITDKLAEELTKPDFVKRVQEETHEKYKVDISKTDKETPQASFRKLNVD